MIKYVIYIEVILICVMCFFEYKTVGITVTPIHVPFPRLPRVASFSSNPFAEIIVLENHLGNPAIKTRVAKLKEEEQKTHHHEMERNSKPVTVHNTKELNKQFSFNMGDGHHKEESSAAGKHGVSTDEKSHHNRGDDLVVNHDKSYDEKKGKKTKSFDEDKSDGGHHKDGHKVYTSESKSGSKDKNGKSEKGFYNAYHKSEFHKKLDYFGNEHKGGGYKTYGHHNEKHSSHDSEADEKKHKKAGGSETHKKKPIKVVKS